MIRGACPLRHSALALTPARAARIGMAFSFRSGGSLVLGGWHHRRQLPSLLAHHPQHMLPSRLPVSLGAFWSTAPPVHIPNGDCFLLGVPVVKAKTSTSADHAAEGVAAATAELLFNEPAHTGALFIFLNFIICVVEELQMSPFFLFPLTPSFPLLPPFSTGT